MPSAGGRAGRGVTRQHEQEPGEGAEGRHRACVKGPFRSVSPSRMRTCGAWVGGHAGGGASRDAHVREGARVAPPCGGGAMELEAARRAVLAESRWAVSPDRKSVV